MDELHQKEWEVARETIQNFDERLHDLRKYGFSFLTALLAADAILTPLVISAEGVPQGIPNGIKFAVLLVTLVLIIALCLLDRSYVLFIESSVQRAMILERILNIELTETITQRHNDVTISKFDRAVYPLFSVGVAILGLALFWLDALFLRLTVVFVALAVLGTIGIGWGLQLRDSPRGPLDWVLSHTECEQGDPVIITVTNLCKGKPGWFSRQLARLRKRSRARKAAEVLRVWGYEVSGGKVVFKPGRIGRVHAQLGETAPTTPAEPTRAEDYVYDLSLPEKVSIPPQGSYSCTWPTKSARLGIYEVIPGTGESSYTGSLPNPLRRKIVLVKKKVKEEPKKGAP